MPWTCAKATLEIAFIGNLDCQNLGLALMSFKSIISFGSE